MPSCLGIYVQDNLIKYAKVSKERNNVKVEAYGVKFYDTDIEKIIEQIIKETFSFQTPISINIDNEKYTYSSIFGLLKPQDLEKAIETEFEFFCNNNNQNRNTVEYRKLIADDLEDRDKKRIVYTYVDKTNIVERIQLIDKYKAQSLFPIATVIPNLSRNVLQEDCVIVNIENTTDVTTIVNGKVYKIDQIDQGMSQILTSIAVRENSIQKAYEICKNTTVYTRTGQNLRVEGNEYLDDIVVTLMEIIDKVKDIIVVNGIDISSVYITGSGLIINNIDLLFQENFIDKKCELLVPYFIERTNVKVNIKDYIEVNSAISLAMQGLETKNQPTNFNDKVKLWQNIVNFLNTDIKKTNKTKKERTKISLKGMFTSNLDTIEKFLLRGAAGLVMLSVIYIVITNMLTNSINKKIAETEETIQESETEIAKVANYTNLINARTSEYQKLIDAIDEANARISESYSSKNAIPNLLNKIMYNIPSGVQLLSIKNQTGKQIEINAQAKKYDQLGYFKAVLEEEGILTNVTTTKGTKPNQGDYITVTITGELPY